MMQESSLRKDLPSRFTVSQRSAVNPGRLLALGYVAMIAVGTGLLSLPFASHGCSVIDALFTASSATCVTGLIVKVTPHDFTLFGQIVILILIQIGGLGIMTLATTFLLRIVPRLSFKSKLALQGSLGGDEIIQVRQLLKAVVVTTILFESVGAIALFVRLIDRFPFGKAVYYSIFHSVSAFCNAGFSTFSNSLVDFQGDIAILLIFSFLIICGGLGFIVIAELFSKIGSPQNRLSLHTKLCLSGTALIIIAATLAIFSVEKHNSFEHMNFVTALTNSFFQSVTSRTAGFNAFPQSDLNEISLLLIMILMFIGGCPGSTAGGIKVTSFLAVILLAFNRLRGFATVKAFRRSISADSVNRSITVILVAIAVIVVMFVLLMFAQERPLPHKLTHGWFIDSAFEIVSAFGTVGLSLGTTGHLHDLGKIVIIVLMFNGRVGLLTLVIILVRPQKRGEVVYLDEQIMVG